MLVMLVGFRGSGKSSVGKRLAGDLWYKFADTDQIIAQNQGVTIAQFFAKFGEETFREVESNVVKECCKLNDHVVALGGGAVLREDNRGAIISSGAKIVYLKCDPVVLAKRIEADPKSAETRPALAGVATPEDAKRMAEEREAIYRKIATFELDVTALGIEESAKYVARML